MKPEDVPDALVEKAARVVDPDAFEAPLRYYGEGAGAQARTGAGG